MMRRVERNICEAPVEHLKEFCGIQAAAREKHRFEVDALFEVFECRVDEARIRVHGLHFMAPFQHHFGQSQFAALHGFPFGCAEMQFGEEPAGIRDCRRAAKEDEP